jgi:hypothetical protein
MDTALSNPLNLSAEICAKQIGLPLPLVRAIIQVESSGDIYGWNPEPKYRYFWDVRLNRPFRPVTAQEIASESPPPDFLSGAGDRDAEWWGQAASWGPMQVMGGVARELGLKGHFPQLCTTHLGVEYGCRHLAHLARRFRADHGWRGVAAAFNAGSPRKVAGTSLYENQAYVDKIARAGGFGSA